MTSNKKTGNRQIEGLKGYTLSVKTANGSENLTIRGLDQAQIKQLQEAGLMVKEQTKWVKPRYAKITAEVRDKLIWLLEHGNTYTFSCEAVDVSPTYMNEYRKRHPRFDAKVNAARDGQTDGMADALYMTGIGGNVTAQIFFLTNRTRFLPRSDPRKWLNVQAIEVSGPDGSAMQFNDTDAENERKIQEYEQRIATLSAKTSGAGKLPGINDPSVEQFDTMQMIRDSKAKRKGNQGKS